LLLIFTSALTSALTCECDPAEEFAWAVGNIACFDLFFGEIEEFSDASQFVTHRSMLRIVPQCRL